MLFSDSLLEVTLPEYNETLRPTFAVREPVADAKGGTAGRCIQEVAAGLDLDAAPDVGDHRWQASPQARFERLLRKTQVPIGLLSTARIFGWSMPPAASRRASDLSGRGDGQGRGPADLRRAALLSAERLFSLPDKQRLPAILADSRKYQNEVSSSSPSRCCPRCTSSCAASRQPTIAQGRAAARMLADDPDEVYPAAHGDPAAGVPALRRGARHASERRDVCATTRSRDCTSGCATTTPATPTRWTSATARGRSSSTLFRMVHDGGRPASMHMPPRHGALFDPDRFPFSRAARRLERQPRAHRAAARARRHGLPRARQAARSRRRAISYRALDVEQIGSVYETMMGFRLELATGRSVAIKPQKSPRRADGGRPRGAAPGKRRQAREVAARPRRRKLTAKVAAAVKEAETIEDSARRARPR